MSVVLYTTHCPKCRVLEGKMKDKGIEFDIIDDENVMIKKGFMSAPMLDVGGKVMDFGNAVKWLNSKE